MHLSTKARTGQCHIPLSRVQALLCEPENHKSSRTFLLSFARDIFQEKFNVVKPVKKKKKKLTSQDFFPHFFHALPFCQFLRKETLKSLLTFPLSIFFL